MGGSSGPGQLRSWLVSSPGYMLWLGWQIVQANWDVARRVWSRNLRITPSMIRLQHQLRSDEGLAAYAISISLTPGTAPIAVDQDAVLVHALSAEAAEDLRQGAMEARLRRLEGGSP